METNTQPLVSDERQGLPSASGLERMLLCPGSWNLERQLPPEPETEEAASGTRIHSALAGEPRALEKLSSDEFDTYEMCLVQRDTLYEACLPEPDEAVVYAEIREWLHRPGRTEPLMSGKADVLALNSYHGLVLDYKTGRNEATESPRNIQLRALALIMAEAFGLQYMTVAIVQPLVTKKPLATEYSISDLQKAEAEILQVLANASDPKAPRRPGSKQCQYCRAKTVCPEARALVKRVAEIKIDSLTGQELGLFLKTFETAQYIIDRGRGRAKELLAQDPQAIPGWKLKEGNTRREIKDAQEAFKLLARNNLIAADDFVSCCKVKIGEVEKKVASVSGMTKKETKEKINQLLAPVMETAQNQPSLEEVE